jgi:hypothetical protein
MQVPLSWERLLWSRRSTLRPWERYALTDFRVVRLAGRHSQEIPLEDIGDIRRDESWVDAIAGTSTISIHARGRRRDPVVLAHVRRGAQLAALLELVCADPQGPWDPQSVSAALAWEPRTRVAGYREAALSSAALAAIVFVVAISLHGKTPAVIYPDDDSIYPKGVKKDPAAILRFMETEVMPWARATLGPLKGGADQVSCETCHGRSPLDRDWKMPAVATLPQPDVTLRGWEVYSAGMDAQMRNAIYGYIADTDNQRRAAYMREVVMPGMARLLHRPAYDFTRSYEYNRTHFAFGCYHCHRVS